MGILAARVGDEVVAPGPDRNGYFWLPLRHGVQRLRVDAHGAVVGLVIRDQIIDVLSGIDIDRPVLHVAVKKARWPLRHRCARERDREGGGRPRQGRGRWRRRSVQDDRDVLDPRRGLVARHQCESDRAVRRRVIGADDHLGREGGRTRPAAAAIDDGHGLFGQQLQLAGGGVLYLAGDLDPAAVLTELRGDGGGGDDAGLKRPAGRQRGQRPERGQKTSQAHTHEQLGLQRATT